jgi:hypothetical protein
MVDSRRETGDLVVQTVQKSTRIREQKGEERQEIADRRWGQKDGSFETGYEEGAEGRSEKESVRWMRLEKRREGKEE